MGKENKIISIQPYRRVQLVDGTSALKSDQYPTRVVSDNDGNTGNKVVELFLARRSDLGKKILRDRLEEEVEEVMRAKKSFYGALGISPDSKEYNQKLSYEPWTERARFERIKRSATNASGKEILIQAFQKESELQMITNLRERYNSEKSKTRYDIKDGKLYSELLPTEPFENILLRGLEAQRQAGSLELVREEKEVEGFVDSVQSFFGDSKTSVGAKMILFSPKGLIKDSQYKKKFVDILELRKDQDGERYVESTRFTTGLDYDGYKKSALKLDPQYFVGFDKSGLALDAWFISHPINVNSGSVEEIYDRFIEKDYKAMKEAQFQKIPRRCMPGIKYYIDELCKDVIDWQQLAIAFNAILNIGDNVVKGIEGPKLKDHFYDGEFPEKIVPVYYNKEQINHWGRQKVQEVAGGCPGVSKGFEISKISYGFENSTEALLNSVGKFAESEKLTDDLGDREFDCPVCNHRNVRPYNQKIERCQNEKCPDPTKVACA